MGTVCIDSSSCTYAVWLATLNRGPHGPHCPQIPRAGIPTQKEKGFVGHVDKRKMIVHIVHTLRGHVTWSRLSTLST